MRKDLPLRKAPATEIATTSLSLTSSASRILLSAASSSSNVWSSSPPAPAPDAPVHLSPPPLSSSQTRSYPRKTLSTAMFKYVSPGIAVTVVVVPDNHRHPAMSGGRRGLMVKLVTRRLWVQVSGLAMIVGEWMSSTLSTLNTPTEVR